MVYGCSPLSLITSSGVRDQSSSRRRCIINIVQDLRNRYVKMKNPNDTPDLLNTFYE